MPAIDFVSDAEAVKDFGFEPDEGGPPIAPTFKSPIDLRPVNPTDIQETERMGTPRGVLDSASRGLGTAALAARNAVIGGMGDLGRIAFRPLTDQLYPEQAESGDIPGGLENLKSVAENPLAKTPADNLRVLPKSLQRIGGAAQGLLGSVPQMAAVAGMQSVGIPAPIAAGMVFGSTEQGFDPVQGAIGAALPLAGRVSGGLAGMGARAAGVESVPAINLIKGIGGVAGPSAALIAQGEHEIAKLPEEQRAEAREELYKSVAGMAALGPIGVKFEKSPLPRAKLAAMAAAVKVPNIIMGSSLSTPQGAPYPFRETERLQTVNAEESERAAKAMQATATAAYEPPKPDRPTVPGTPVEREINLNVLQEIRRSGARTKSQIQDLFPIRQLSREEAGRLQKQVWSPVAENIIDTETDPRQQLVNERDALLRIKNKRASDEKRINQLDVALGDAVDPSIPQQTKASAETPAKTPRDLINETVSGKPLGGATPQEGTTAAQPAPSSPLHPEVQQHLSDATSGMDVEVHVVPEVDPEVARLRAQWEREHTGRFGLPKMSESERLLAEQESADQGPDAITPKAGQIATIQRADPNVPGSKDRIVLFSKNLNDWIMKDIPPAKRAEAMRTLLAHERIHLATDAADAGKYLGTLTALEKGIERKLYGQDNVSDQNLGYEALRRRIERLARMDTTETLHTIGKERWKRKSLEAVNDAVRSIREKMGTKASKEGLAILDKVQSNLNSGLVALGGAGAGPAAMRPDTAEDKAPGETTPQEIDKLSRDDAVKFFTDNQKRGNAAQRDSVLAGMKLEPLDVPELKRLSETSAARMKDAIKAGDNAAFQAEFGKHVWYNGAIEGANRKGPNYEAVSKTLPATDLVKAALDDKGTSEDPAAMRPKQPKEHPELFLPPIPGERATAAEMGANQVATPQFLTPDKIDFEGPRKESAFRPISAAESKSPSALEALLTKDARIGGQDVSRTLTHRVTAVFDKYSGRVEVVSTYPHSKNGVMMADPSRLSSEASRPHRQISTLLNRYTPLYSIYLKEPVQNFHERFESMQDFQKRFGATAAEESGKRIGVEPARAESGSGRGVPFQAEQFQMPVEVPEVPAPQKIDLTAFYDFFKGRTPKTPEQMRDQILRGTANTSRQMLSAMKRMMEGEMAANPDLSAEQALENTYRNFYEDITKSPDQSGFIDRSIQRHGEAHATPVERPGGNRGEGKISPVEAKTGQSETPKVEPPGAFRDLKQNLKDTGQEAGEAFSKLVSRHGLITDVAGSIDSTENTSNNRAQQAEFRVRVQSMQKPGGKVDQFLKPWERGNRQVLSSANVLIEAEFDKANLTRFQGLLDDAKTIGTQEAADPSWKVRGRGKARLREVAELQSMLSYAKDHWNDADLQSSARRAQEAYKDILDNEKAEGYDVTEDPNYLPHRYVSGLRIGQKTFVLGKGFRQPKSFDSLFDAIAAPDGLYISATHDGASLVGHRSRQSLNMINKDKWQEGLKAIDLPDGSKLALAPKNTPMGSSSPDPNYRLVQVRPGKTIAIHRDYADSIENLTSPDWVEKWGPSRGALHLSQMLKHTLLVGDFFHLFRTGYYGTAILGRQFGWRKGLSILDIAERDIPEAVKRGVITPEDAAWGNEKVKYGTGDITRRQLIEKFYTKMGSNLGRIQDALYKDLITEMTSASPGWRRGLARAADPTLGRYNRFLFDKLTRGLMAESVAREFERQQAKLPDANPEKLMADISRDVNNFYGNIGRQGWLKSAGMRSFSRMLMLAPQWVEGLAKKEAISYMRLTGSSSLAGKRQGLTALGTTGTAVGRGLLFMAGLAQAINLITRGKTTFQNEEDGHKLDAWIPAWGSNKEGFWLSPLAIYNELTHDLIRLGESKPTFAEATSQIIGNKESPMVRALMVLKTGQTPTGEMTTTTAGRLSSAAGALAPVPITFGRFAQAAGHAVAPGAISATPPGAMMRQGAGVFGVKIEPALSAPAIVTRMAKQFMQKEGLTKSTGWIQMQTDEPSYTKLRAALRSKDDAKALKMLNELRKQHTDPAIIRAMKQYSVRPFTGSRKTENLFLGSLDDKALDTYSKAREQSMGEFQDFTDFYIRQP